MEGQILRYYLKVSRIIIIIFIFVILFFLYAINKEIYLDKEIISINKGDSITKVFKKNISNISNLEIFFIKLYYYYNSILNNKFIHFGEFRINNIISSIDLISLISQPSNVVNKITVFSTSSFILLYISIRNFIRSLT